MKIDVSPYNKTPYVDQHIGFTKPVKMSRIHNLHISGDIEKMNKKGRLKDSKNKGVTSIWWLGWTSRNEYSVNGAQVALVLIELLLIRQP